MRGLPQREDERSLGLFYTKAEPWNILGLSKISVPLSGLYQSLPSEAEGVAHGSEEEPSQGTSKDAGQLTLKILTLFEHFNLPVIHHNHSVDRPRLS